MLLAIALLVIPVGCDKSPDYEVLAGEMDLSVGYSINPAKVKVNRHCNIPVTVTNYRDNPVNLNISTVTPNSTVQGFIALGINDEYRIVPSLSNLHLEPREVYTFNLSVEKKIGIGDRHRESWVSFAEVTDEQVQTKLCMRILIR